MRVVFAYIFVFFLWNCGDGILRGREVKSTDSKTYLVVEDDNGGGCGPILVDGQIWEYEIGEAGEIDPGVHTITCGSSIGFEISEGVVFYFDYWGP